MKSTIDHVYKSSLNLLVPQSPEDTFKTIVKEAVELVQAKYGSIILHQDGKLKRIYSSSPIAFKTVNRRFGNTYKAFKSGEVIISGIQDIKSVHPELLSFGVNSTIFIPLSYRNKTIGVLTINSAKSVLEIKEDIYALRLFGSMASLAIRKAEAYMRTSEALELRDIFISIASHELRTPLTAINGYIQLLQSRVSQEKPINKEWIQNLSKESERLTLMVKELLEVNTIKSGKLNYTFKEINLEEIIQRVLANFALKASARKINFSNKIQGKPILIGDHDKLIQVFTNLLDNSTKFSPVESDIFITLTENKNDYLIEISDQGIGIPSHELKNIFEKFYKGESHLHPGMGVGLYVTSNIIKEHHGKIVIKSKVNKGTKVVVQLPKRKS
jgi:signal transduction histidine kinase